jgi:hypothetical protein
MLVHMARAHKSFEAQKKSDTTLINEIIDGARLWVRAGANKDISPLVCPQISE